MAHLPVALKCTKEYVLLSQESSTVFTECGGSGTPHASYQSGGEHNMYPCNCKFTGPEVHALAWCSGGTLRPYSDLKALTREIENGMKVEVRSLCPGLIN